MFLSIQVKTKNSFEFPVIKLCYNNSENKKMAPGNPKSHFFEK